MKTKNILIPFIVASLLTSCSTVPNKTKTYLQKHPNALIKLPQKTVVHLQTQTDNLIKNRNIKTDADTAYIPQPATPVWVPPKISRVLIYPYVDSESRLHAGQYIFITLKQGHWLFGNYLDNEKTKILNPLKNLKVEKNVNPKKTIEQRNSQENNFFYNSNKKQERRSSNTILQNDVRAFKGGGKK